MGQLPINSKLGTHQILSFFSNMGLHYLNQISNWDAQSLLWTRWHFPEFPTHIDADLGALQAHLHGISPIKKDSEDEFHWDPSGSTYTIKVAYQYLCNNDYPMPIWSNWKAA